MMKKLILSYAVTTTCSSTLTFLIPLYVFELTGEAILTSLTFFAAMAPYILVTPFAGVWSDRYSKKRFLIAGDISSAIVAAVIYCSLTSQSGVLLASVLILLNFVLASISATHHPMFQSLAPEILKPETLKEFNSIINAIDNTVRIIAPVLVAGLLSFTTKTNILIACGIGFIFSLPLLALLPAPKAGRKSSTGTFRELVDGIRYVLGDANLFSFSLLFFCVNFGLALIGSNLVYIFSSIFEVSQQGLGYYYGIIGLGAVAGSFVAPKLIGAIDDAGLIITCCSLAGALALLACFSTTPSAMALVWAISTACQSIVVVTFFTFRQKVVPSELLGRTVGVTRLISYLAIPPASVIGGILMDKTHSLVAVMGSGGLAIILGSIVALRAPAFRPFVLGKSDN